MSTSILDEEKTRQEQELRIQRQIAFASGIFQGDVTIRTLLESLAEGVVIIDNTGTILLVNSRAAQMFGYQEKELAGKPHAVLIPGRFRKVHEEHEAHYFAEPRIRPMGQLLELYGQRRDGSEFPVEISLGYIETENGVLVMALVSDMTLRKQYETRLGESEELFHAQVEGVKDYAVFMLDSQGNVLNWNTGAERLKGYRAEEIIGRHFSCFYPEEERNAGRPEEELKKAAAEGRGEVRGWRIRKDGIRFWADVIITALYDENDNLRGFSKVTRDITERKEAEEELERQKEKLLESEQRFASFMSHLPAAAWIKDLLGRYVYANAEAERIFSRQHLTELAGKTDEEIFPPETARLFVENDRRVLAEGGSLQTTETLPQANGIEHHSIVTKFAMSGPDGLPAYVAGVALDITERKRAEEALRLSEERYRALFWDNPTMIVTLDTYLTILTVNPTCAGQLGYTTDELEGQSVLKLFHADDRPIVSEQLWNCLQHPDQVYRWQFRKVRKDGELRWVEETAQAVHDLNGMRNILVVCQDITERKRLEEELRESEERFRATFDQAAVGIGHVTPEGRWLRINRKYCDIVGYTEEELKSLTIKDITHPDDLEKSMQHYQLLLEGKLGNYSLEKRYIHKDGSTVWVNLTASMVSDAAGKPSFAVGVVEDITTRKRVEEALIWAKEEWERTFDSVPDLIAILDDHCRIVRVNRAMADRLGRRREECEGLLCYSAIHGTESPPEFCPHSKTLADGREHVAEVHDAFLGGDFLVSHTPLLAPAGRMARIVHVARDITERKRAEEEIERLNASLAARADDLEDANKELEAFNYSVAHDLRNPLNVISSYCQVIRELCGDKLDEQCSRYLQEAYNGTMRMNRLIEALLQFSRLARAELKRETADLGSMAKEVTGELKLTEPARRVETRIADGMVANGDASLLRVVLANLLGNAWKYTSVREEAVIEFGMKEIDGQPVYFVRDNGAGFNMADEDKLFTPFQRLPGAEECRGFGIGLATVERIIRRHGGRVWAEGEPDRGATFYFTFSAG